MYQTCIIVGNLGADADYRYNEGENSSVCHFNVAVNERWTSRDGQPQEKTTWFRVTLWGRLADSIHRYLTRGKQVFVEGTIDASAYKTQQDGTARASLELRARTVRLLGGRGDDWDSGGRNEGPGDEWMDESRSSGNRPAAGNRRTSQAPRGGGGTPPPPADEGDIPF